MTSYRDGSCAVSGLVAIVLMAGVVVLGAAAPVAAAVAAAD
ncbi:hypothetical protein [Actinomadura rupiterrae]|nr:hypothetical protein [Actinomadura rupiterrae]MCP2339245.1 hypothetical protein [Actinomadura rupiterrae]